MRVRLSQDALDWFEERNVSFDNRFGSRIKLGDILQFQDDIKIEPYIGIHGGNIICNMGFLSYSNSPLVENMTVGRYCSLARNINFQGYRHPVEHISTSVFTHDKTTDLVLRVIRDHEPSYRNFFPNPQKAMPRIGHDVWIGHNVLINPGVTIGTGAIVAAHSVVTRSVLPYEIVGGNPAQKIKMRFPAEVVNELLLSEWWRYKFTDFAGIDLSNPEIFLRDFFERKEDLQPYVPELINVSEIAAFCEVV